MDGSCWALLRVRRFTAPPSSWPSTNLSKRTLSAGFTSLSDPRNPFLRTPTRVWVSPSTVTAASNQVKISSAGLSRQSAPASRSNRVRV